MAEALFVQTNDIPKFTSLSGNTDIDKYQQFLKIAQDIHIHGHVGTKLFDKMQADIEAGTLTGSYLALNTKFIKPMLIHWAMVEYIPFAAYTMGNKGISKHSSESSDSVSKGEVDYLVEKERDIAQHYTDRFIRHMKFNKGLYPEYSANVDDDIKPDTSLPFGGWSFLSVDASLKDQLAYKNLEL